MDFELSSAEQAVRAEALVFANDGVAASVASRDLQRCWDPQLFRAMGGRELLAAPWSQAHDHSMFHACLALEAVAEGARDAGLGVAWIAHSAGCGFPIARFGSAEQRAAYLPQLGSGEWLGAHIGRQHELRAIRRGDDWVLDGTCRSVINAPVAQLFCVEAMTARGKESFLVERDLPRVQIGQTLDTLGLCSALRGDVRFDACVLPDQARLGCGEREHAGRVGDAILDRQRAATAAYLVGLVFACWNDCRECVRDGSELGRPLRDFQLARRSLADMRIGAELSRGLAYRAAQSANQNGAAASFEAASALLFACDTFVQTAGGAVVLAAPETPLYAAHAARLHRDSAAFSASTGGASQRLRSAVAGAVVGLG